MAWPKKMRSMSIEPAKNGMMTTMHPTDYSSKPNLPTFHPSVAHLQAHIGKTFGPQKAAKASSIAAGTPRSARAAGGGAALQPSPAMAQIASSMASGPPEN